MTKKLAFQIFLWGTLSSGVLFLWLTFDTQRQVATLAHADRLSDQVVAGKRVFEQYNCGVCEQNAGRRCEGRIWGFAIIRRSRNRVPQVHSSGFSGTSRVDTHGLTPVALG